MDHIKFCRDGILRRHASAWNPIEGKHTHAMVPLLAWEKAVDHDLFLKTLHSPITLEPGLTIGELFENLAPWSAVMTGVACMDFPAFLTESRRAPSGEFMEHLSHIELRWRASLSPVPAFEREEDMFSEVVDDQGFRSLNVGTPKITGRIRLESGWDNHAMLTEAGKDHYDGSDSVSLSFSPLSDWAHLEIRVVMDGLLHDETASPHSAAYMGTETPLTNPAHPLVSGREQRPNAGHRMACDVPTPTFFNAIVQGLLWDIGFNYSPAQRDDTAEIVKGSIRELQAGLDGEAPTDFAGDGITAYDQQKMHEFEGDMQRIRDAEVMARALGLAAPDLVN